MTGKVVNLRQARKAKARADKRAGADASAARHGRTKAERAREADETARAERLHKGHKIEDQE